MTAVESVRALLASGALELPLPRSGRSGERLMALHDIARRHPLSVARLAEGHLDAMAILAEAGREPRCSGLYAVWASETGEPLRWDGRELRGRKRFCSGSDVVDAALITAETGHGVVLLEIPSDAFSVVPGDLPWASPAMAESRTATVELMDAKISEPSMVGRLGWYLERPGFWAGALFPAACWAGGAAGLVDAAERAGLTGPHREALLGALDAERWLLKALLETAGRELDARPPDEGVRDLALRFRHLVERACARVIDAFGSATGPRLLAFDADVGARVHDLLLYTRQCHGPRDLEDLGELTLASTTEEEGRA